MSSAGIVDDKVTVLLKSRHTTPNRPSLRSQPQISATFGQLRLRPAEFPALLCQLGFLPAQLVGEPQHAASGFSRQLQLFVKVPPAGGGGGEDGRTERRPLVLGCREI